MQVTLGNIATADAVLAKLSKCDMNAASAFKLSRIINSLTPELEQLKKQNNVLVSKYTEEVDGKKILPNDNQDFWNEIGELLKTEIELSIEPITLKDIENLSLSPVDIASLGPFLVENTKE